MSRKKALIVGLGLMFGATLAYAKVVDKTLAIVNGEAIMYSEFEKTISPVLDQYKQSMPVGEQSDKKISDLRQKLLEQMVDDKLLRQTAKKEKIRTTKREIDEGIKEVRARFKTEDDFRSELAKENLTEDQFNKRIEEQLMVMKLIESEIKSKVQQPTDADIKDFYDKITAKMAGKNLGLPQKDEDDIASIAKYLKGMSAEQVRARHILIKVDKNAKLDEKTAALKKIQMILKEYKAGTSFDKLAEKYSQDQGSAAKGGDLGYFAKGDMVPEFEKVAFSLNVGEVSEPVLTDFGYHIIRVEEKRAAKNVSYDDVKNDLKEVLFQKAAQKRYEAWLKDLRAKANIKINPID
jgi:parvulin-like peptidyl-prolyl isomerase